MYANKNVSVVVPVSHVMTDIENFSFERTLKVFSSREIIIIGPPCLEDYFIELCKLHNNISYIFFERVFQRGVRFYSRLFMSREFYKHFLKYDYIIVCQIDVFVIKDDIDYWCEQGYDTIGAPIFEGYTNPTDQFKEKGNNGGFALRNPKACFEVLTKNKWTYSNISSLWKMESKWCWKFFRVIRDGLIFNYKLKCLRPVINEDVYWSIIVPDKFPGFKVCPPEQAKFFAYDVNPRYLYEKSNKVYPMAIHAWWRYDREFSMDVLKSLDIKFKI